MTQNALTSYYAAIERAFKENQELLPPEKRCAPLNVPICGEGGGREGYICTLIVGHSGGHVAHGSLGTILKEWNNGEGT